MLVLSWIAATLLLGMAEDLSDIVMDSLHRLRIEQSRLLSSPVPIAGIDIEKTALLVNSILAGVAVVALILNALAVLQSRRSVIAAEEAAKAAKRSADTQAAALPLDFGCMIFLPGEPGMRRGHVSLRCKGARLFVHGVTVVSTYEGLPDGFTMRLAEYNAAARSDESLPHLLHVGDSMSFRWPKLPLTENRLIEAVLRIEYSFDPETGPVHSRERHVPVKYSVTGVPKPAEPSED